MPTVGSILHGAYGDYYEQLLCLKQYKRSHPDTRLVLFFASEHRRKELAVLDLSFADEVHGAEALTATPVDRFFQFQIHDPCLLPSHFNLANNEATRASFYFATRSITEFAANSVFLSSRRADTTNGCVISCTHGSA